MASFTVTNEQLSVLVSVAKQNLEGLDEYLELHSGSASAEWLAQLRHRRAVLHHVCEVLVAAGDV